MLAASGKDGTQSNGVDVESQQVVEGATHGMVLPFKQVTVSFHNVRYFVPIPEVRPQVTRGKYASMTDFVREFKTRTASTPYIPTSNKSRSRTFNFDHAHVAPGPVS